MTGITPVTYSEVALFHVRCEDLLRKGCDLERKERALIKERDDSNGVSGERDAEKVQEIKSAVTAFFLEAEQVKSEVKQLKGRVEKHVQNRDLVLQRNSRKDSEESKSSDGSDSGEDIYLDGLALVTLPHKLGGLNKMINEISEKINDLKKEIF